MSNSIFLSVADESHLGITIVVSRGVIMGSTWESIVAGAKDLAIGTDNNTSDFSRGIFRPTRYVLGKR